jgi:capsular polysaccharide biosynthesis protein
MLPAESRGRSNKHVKKVTVTAPHEAAAMRGPESPSLSGTLIPGGSLLHMFAREWKRIVLITLAATAFAWVLSSLQPPRYRASALAAVGPLTATLQPNELLRGLEVLEQPTVVATIARLASTETMRSRVGASKDYAIGAEVVADTNLFRVEVEGTNAQETARLANEVTQRLGEQTRAMYKYYGVSPISPAVPPPESGALERHGRAVAAGFAIGLMIGLLAAYATQWRSALRGRTA